MNNNRSPNRILFLGTSFIPPVFLSCYQRMRSSQEFSSAHRRLQGHTKLHLACGNNLLLGWANVDHISRKGIIRYDLTKPLPIDSGTIEFIFTEHFIEHLTLNQCRTFLLECYRVLIPGGVIRLSTPDLRRLLDAYLAGNLAIWSDVGFSPPSPCQMVNDGMRLWGHQFLYDAQELICILEESGFSMITPVQWHVSNHSELMNLECRPYHGELIFEAKKG